MLGPFKGRWGSIIVATAGLCLLAITPAGATGPSTSIGQLRNEDANLASRSRAAVIQLYSLDARLTSAEGRLTTLHVEMKALEEQRGWLLDERRTARLDTRLSQQRLASRLRFIYDHGTTTSLDILMGASSLGDALSQLDDVNKVAASNADVLGEVRASHRHLLALSRNLETRRKALEASTLAASSLVTQLQQLRAARGAYIAGLAQQQSLDARRIDALTAQAQAAAARAQTLTAADTSRTPQATTVLSPPVSTSGATSFTVPAIAGAQAASMPRAGARSLTVVATGYDLSGRTSTGLPVGWGIAAVDPSVIPLGTRIVIPGYGEAIAADTGGAIVGSTIDLWFPSAGQAMAWGRRTITISVN